METLAQGSLALCEVESDGFSDLEVREHFISHEFANVSQRQAAVNGELLAGDLASGKAGSGGGGYCVRFHGNAGRCPTSHSLFTRFSVLFCSGSSGVIALSSKCLFPTNPRSAF